MLRKIRLTFAIFFFVLITLLFLDFTGTLHGWFGWLAKIQFLPAVLALNVGVILFLVILTLVCGRIYCSVICPLGVFQDILAWLGRQPKKRRKLPYSYSPALSWLRYGVLGVFIIALIAGIGSLAALLAPYSAYGRIANNLFQPIWQWGHNLLAYLAERADSYAFYETDVWLKSLPTFIIAAATLAVLVVLAGRNGRTYCNTICPVGTVLGFLSRYSLFRITIGFFPFQPAAVQQLQLPSAVSCRTGRADSCLPPRRSWCSCIRRFPFPFSPGTHPASWRLKRSFCRSPWATHPDDPPIFPLYRK